MTFIISFSCFTGLSFTTTDDVTLFCSLNYKNNLTTVMYLTQFLYRTQMSIHILSLSRFLSYYAINSKLIQIHFNILICLLSITSNIRSKLNFSLKSITYFFSSFILITILPLSDAPLYKLYFRLTFSYFKIQFLQRYFFLLNKEQLIYRKAMFSINFLTCRLGLLTNPNTDLTFFFVIPPTLYMPPFISINSGTAKTSRPCVFLYIYFIVTKQKHFESFISLLKV